jgi:ABC-2 type transport system ATP-binding protein/nitrous oxidase accessory protein
MLTVRSLSKRFGDRLVLKGIDLAVGPGQVVAVLGPNGAGKTTIFRCVLGLVHFQGQVLVGGLDVRRHGREVRRLIGYVPQSPAFHPHMTVEETVRYYARLRGLDGNTQGLIATMGLDSISGKRVRELSGGMLQRLAVTVAQLGRPPLMLLDEPFANLDREGQAQLASMLREWQKAGVAILVASHHLGPLVSLVDRAVALEEGRVVYEGPLAGLPVPLGVEAPREGEAP